MVKTECGRTTEELVIEIEQLDREYNELCRTNEIIYWNKRHALCMLCREEGTSGETQEKLI